MTQDDGGQFIGVILAAGEGARLRPLSFEKPKPLLPVCNKPIIQHQIEYMRSIGIQKVLIVIGQMGRHIMETFQNGESLGVHIRYIIQDKPLGIAHAVYQLEDEVDRPFLLFLGDIFIVPNQLQKMLSIFKEKSASAVIAVKRESDPEAVKRNFVVYLNANGTIAKVVEKPRYFSENIKGCGIYLFGLPIFDAIRRTPRTAMRDEYEITTSIQILIEDGLPVYPADVVRWDLNVTIPSDLLICNLKMLRHLKSDKLIGAGVKVPSGIQIINSVVGDNVVIENPIRIVNSLLASDVVVRNTRDLDHVIITRENTIQCSSISSFLSDAEE